MGIPARHFGHTLGWGLTVFPADDPLLGGVANVNLGLKLIGGVLEPSTATALSQSKLVDGLLALASEEHGDLAEVVSELGGAEARVG
jgi:hypothetical protein